MRRNFANVSHKICVFRKIHQHSYENFSHLRKIEDEIMEMNYSSDLKKKRQANFDINV